MVTQTQDLEHQCTWHQKSSIRLCHTKAKMQTCLHLEFHSSSVRSSDIPGRNRTQSKMNHTTFSREIMARMLNSSGIKKNIAIECSQPTSKNLSRLFLPKSLLPDQLWQTFSGTDG